MKRVKKILSVILLLTMLATIISGCGSRQISGENVTAENQEGSKPGSEAFGESNENIAMGRYVEEVTDLSDQIGGWSNRIFKLSDGQIIISDKYNDFIVSKDNGVTWETYQQDWFRELIDEEKYIYDLEVGLDGTVYVVIDKKDAGEESAQEEEDSQEEENEGSEEERGIVDIFNGLLIVKPDGAQQFVETPVENNWIRNVWISENGRVFITMYGEAIYEVMEDGTCEEFLSLGGVVPDLVQFQGNLMIIDEPNNGYLIYDMKKKIYIEDEILTDFVNENYENRDTNGGDYFDLFFCLKEEGVLYLAGQKGLHRHVIGGSVMEQVIDGSLSSFNNPSDKIEGILPLDNNEFLVLFTGGKLVRFVYDPNVPTVPNERLKVYSLNEDDLIRQAVSIYQTANPEVYVEYEIGIDENSSVTKEDALKSLNTKIMAGDGPDVLILDHMPADTYIDKGLLMDLKPLLDTFEGDDAIFTNFADAFEKDGKIYMMPCEVMLPVILGRDRFLSQMKDLESMADTVEKMRQEIPERDLLGGIASERGVMKMYAMTSVPAWKTEGGEINTQNIADFLKQVKRIYDAQLDGLDSKVKEYWDNINEYYMADLGILREDSKYFRIGMDEISYIGKDEQMVSGTIYDVYAYTMAASVDEIKGFEDTVMCPMPGQSQNVFWAQAIAGISAASKNADRGEDFLRVLLGKENQSSTYWGLPVNRAAFEEKLTIDESKLDEDGCYSAIASSDGSGNFVEMKIYWPDEKEISVLCDWMEGASVPYIEDVRMEDAVYAEGVEYMRGSQSLEETVAAIEEKVALYMAE